MTYLTALLLKTNVYVQKKSKVVDDALLKEYLPPLTL